MPKNVPLNSDGFEDPMAFFKSPADGLTSARSVATRRDFDTPGGVSAYVTPAAKRGRMSALALGSDEEDGSALGKGLLDEDDVLDESEYLERLPQQFIPCGLILKRGQDCLRQDHIFPLLVSQSVNIVDVLLMQKT